MTSYGAVASRGDAANDPRRREAAYGWTLGGLLLCSAVGFVAQRGSPAAAPAAALRAAAPQEKTRSDGATQPHLLIAVVDDMGYGDAPWNSVDFNDATMPYVTRLRAEGLNLETFYTAAQCTPSRSMLMTGRHSTTLGMDTTMDWDAVGGLNTSVQILPSALEANFPGVYGKVLVGKWDLGHAYDGFLPTNRGFDTYHGMLASAYSDWFAHTACDPSQVVCSSPYENLALVDLMSNAQPDPTDYGGKYATDMWQADARTACESLTRSRLYLQLNFNAVHNPVGVPETWFANPGDQDAELAESQAPLTDNTTIVERQELAGALLRVDRAIQATFADFDELLEGGTANTVFLFMSDNGALVSGGGSNYPFRGDKTTAWEGGCRTPAFFWLGDDFAAAAGVDASIFGATYASLFHISDVMPTVLGGLLGAAELPGDLYGLDLSDDLFFAPNAGTTVRDSVFYLTGYNGPHDSGSPEEGGRGRAANSITLAYRDATYKVVMNSGYCAVSDPRLRTGTNTCESTWLGESYLFDIVDDPSESKNLIADPAYADVVDAMRKAVADEYNALVGGAHTGFMDRPYAIFRNGVTYAAGNWGEPRGSGDPVYLAPFLDAPIHGEAVPQTKADPSEFLWVSDDPASETDVSFNDLRAQMNFGSNWKARLDDLMAKLAAEGALP